MWSLLMQIVMYQLHTAGHLQEMRLIHFQSDHITRQMITFLFWKFIIHKHISLSRTIRVLDFSLWNQLIAVFVTHNLQPVHSR